MINLFSLYFKDIRAATAIEYGLIVAAIAVAISVVIFAFGDDMQAMFQNAADMIAGA